MENIFEKIINEWNIQLFGTSYTAWNEVLNQVEYSPCEYAFWVVDYYNTWMKERYDQIIDLSHIIKDGNNFIGLWVVQLRCKEGIWSVGSNYHELSSPVFIKSCSNKTIKKWIKICHERLAIFLEEYSIKTLFLKTESSQEGTSLWYNYWKEKGASFSSIEHMMYVDLTLTYEQIRSKFRSRYKTYINKGKTLWDVQIITQYDRQSFDTYMEYHHKIAGRVTRGPETWNSQRNAMKNGEAFIILTTEKQSGTLVGAAYFFCSKDECIYLSGAYDRTLFDKPVSHITQYSVIEYCKEKGICKYRIGERLYRQDEPAITSKELSISDFKEGFASSTYINIVLKMCDNTK